MTRNTRRRLPDGLRARREPRPRPRRPGPTWRARGSRERPGRGNRQDAHHGADDERRRVAGGVDHQAGHDRAEHQPEVAGHLEDRDHGAALTGHDVTHHRPGATESDAAATPISTVAHTQPGDRRQGRSSRKASAADQQAHHDHRPPADRVGDLAGRQQQCTADQADDQERRVRPARRQVQRVARRRAAPSPTGRRPGRTRRRRQPRAQRGRPGCAARRPGPAARSGPTGGRPARCAAARRARADPRRRSVPAYRKNGSRSENVATVPTAGPATRPIRKAPAHTPWARPRR